VNLLEITTNDCCQQREIVFVAISSRSLCSLGKVVPVAISSRKRCSRLARRLGRHLLLDRGGLVIEVCEVDLRRHLLPIMSIRWRKLSTVVALKLIVGYCLPAMDAS
jgi:hypothetical protein